jgi:hypothetical protein
VTPESNYWIVELWNGGVVRCSCVCREGLVIR